MYGTYTGGFLAFIVLLAILEQVGVPNKILGYLFVGLTSCLRYHRHHDRAPPDFRILRGRPPRAGILQRHGHRRRLDVRRFLHLMAGASFCSAITASAGCWAGPAASCWCRSCSRPTCASSAHYTVPDFLGIRFEGNVARFSQSSCCSALVHLHRRTVFGIGIITSRFLGIEFESRSSSVSPASWCARCWAACGR